MGWQRHFQSDQLWGLYDYTLTAACKSMLCYSMLNLHSLTHAINHLLSLLSCLLFCSLNPDPFTQDFAQFTYQTHLLSTRFDDYGSPSGVPGSLPLMSAVSDQLWTGEVEAAVSLAVLDSLRVSFGCHHSVTMK